MSLSVCIYILTKALPLFHPTSKDSLCGAHGRRNGSMHLCHIHCKIKQWIHGDDQSYKLIKIVHVCGRWKWNTPFMDLSPFYLDNMRTWLYYCIYFFSWTFMCPIFFSTRTFMCPYFFLGHASWPCHHFFFFLYRSYLF